jgi:hypothetical protein
MCYDHQKYVCEVISEVNIELILHIIGFVEIVWDFDNKIHFSVYMHAMFNQITIMFVVHVGFVYVFFLLFLTDTQTSNNILFEWCEVTFHSSLQES